MKNTLRWIGLLVATTFILFLVLYAFTLISQIWPEPISESFQSACAYELPNGFKVSNRKHSYSNWIHGVWYTDHGVVNVSPTMAKEINQKLANNNQYKVKESGFEKFVVGKVLANCGINTITGTIKYGLVLW